MRVIVDFNIHPAGNPYAQAIVDDDGELVDPDVLRNKILVDSYIDEYGRVVFVFTEHTFEDQS